MSEEHEPLASFVTARCPSPTAPPETKRPVPLRLLTTVLKKAAGWTLRVVDEKARTDRLMPALTSNAYHTAVAEQGVMALEPVDRTDIYVGPQSQAMR